MRKLVLLLAVFVVIVSSPVSAWNRVGHWTVASIAYRELNETPAGQMVIRETGAALRLHPAFPTAWKRDLGELHGKKFDALTPEEVDYGLFLLAASWPDDIKDDEKPEYRVEGQEIHGNWHYIDQHYPADPAIKPEPENLAVALTKASNSLKVTDGGPVQRAVSLCWVFHLVGDAHQPLHTVSWMTPQTPAPDGDSGGNKWIVRVSAKADPQTLHAFWDGVLECPLKADDIQNTAQTVVQDYPVKAIAGLENPTLNSWLKRSYDVAARYVYLNGTLHATLDDKDISYSRQRAEFIATYKSAEILTPHYQNTAQNIGREQIALAGNQLARVLETYRYPAVGAP
ncbi:MAG: S1/P1 nuclease [Armatimonadota bacterium]